MSKIKDTAIWCSLLLLFGCTAAPKGITPVTSFTLERYLGSWYEIARLDHSFERGLSRVTADYSKREDGGVDVLNRGYDSATGQWQEAIGRAYPLGSPQTGSLKVSFFRPFYAGYHIIALDQENYEYALVCGPNRSYLWILSRTPVLADTIKQQLIDQATELDFATNELIFVEQQE
jgi:apolipoprotein D and lipocalin family protein